MKSLIGGCVLLLVACTSGDGTSGNGGPTLGAARDARDTGRVADRATSASTTPIVLAANQNMPWTIAIDNENVYWVNSGTQGGVYKVPKAGGTPTPLFEGEMRNVESFGLDATSVYFPAQGAILAVPLAGGPSRTVATTTKQVLAVGVANGEVHWIEPTDDASSSTGAVAKRVGVGGGAATTVDLRPLAQATPEGAYSFVAAPDAVYASLLPFGGIARFAPNGGVATLVVELHVARFFALDDESIYFGTRNTISRVARAGGTPTPLAAAENPGGVAADESSVFFADDTPNGRIVKVSKQDGTVRAIAENQRAPYAIAIDSANVYWNCIDEGAIKKIAK
jgi:hypothetical protein